MIVLDASALAAIVMREDEGPDFLALVARHDCIIGAPTAFEAEMVLAARLGDPAVAALRYLLAYPTVVTVDFTSTHAGIAFDAFQRYGRGRHPARLNFGDCMAYAVAKAENAPLLFKGDDFALTDIAAVNVQGLL